MDYPCSTSTGGHLFLLGIVRSQLEITSRPVQRVLISMIVRESTYSELEKIAMIEQQAHASAFINHMSLAEHEANFEKEEITYLSIVDSFKNLAGFFILASVPNESSIEFRRIVIDRGSVGLGQPAIRKMEQYCRSILGMSRIWLDVYADNDVAIHVYTKLEYQFDRETVYDGRRLLFYSKDLAE